jgi:hypothetical protein
MQRRGACYYRNVIPLAESPLRRAETQEPFSDKSGIDVPSFLCGLRVGASFRDFLSTQPEKHRAKRRFFSGYPQRGS